MPDLMLVYVNTPEYAAARYAVIEATAEVFRLKNHAKDARSRGEIENFFALNRRLRAAEFALRAADDVAEEIAMRYLNLWVSK